MEAHRCFSLSGLEPQHARYLRYLHLRYWGVWGHQTNPRHSKQVLSMQLKSTSEIFEDMAVYGSPVLRVFHGSPWVLPCTVQAITGEHFH